MDPTIAAHRGRIVKTTGDGMLVEFASAVDAARRAAGVQRGAALENVDVPEQARIQFRIGIHVGDIIVGPPAGCNGYGFCAMLSRAQRVLGLRSL